MIEELEQLDDLADEIRRRSASAGISSIWRAQIRSGRRIFVREGRTESSSISSIAGHGLQIITERGQTLLGSRDDFRPSNALELLSRLIETSARAGDLKLHRNAIGSLEPTRARRLPDPGTPLDAVPLDEAARRLVELEKEIDGQVPGTSLQLSFRAEQDAWRICRSDGTDVLFAIPRCMLTVRATSAGGESRHGVGASVFSSRFDMLRDTSTVEKFLARACDAARLARLLPDAPPHPAGSFPLVIDYALAKGLAHEAFGHASEADGFRSSILAKDGRFRVGETVGAEHVSIIDEPVEDDHAWQPFSANGVPRERATIVDHGRLLDSLTDPWSAEAAGARLTGAARAGSFRNAPLPRMTNIRIEVDEPLPAPGEFEEYGPEQVRDLLTAAGVFRRHAEVVYLSGYSGGQVNTTTGDFVFNCKAIYALGPQGVKLHKPAIFSGSMFGALKSIREAFGPLRLDATGYCGKWGQSVPSSGGSHFFLVLDDDPTVRLGGR